MKTIVVNFNQLSYVVREHDDMVMIELIMTRPSPQQFEAVISVVEITTTGMYIVSGMYCITKILIDRDSYIIVI